MTINTKLEDTENSFFVFVKDTTSGKIKRVALPSDVQIGLAGRPAELQLLGRFSISNIEFETTAQNKGVFRTKNDHTIIGIRTTVAPASGRSTVYLPTTPRDGQLHFVKDISGAADAAPIDIFAADASNIDGAAKQSISTAYNCISFYWSRDSWKVLTQTGTSSGGGGGSGASISASYVTINSEAGLTAERHLSSTSNISFTDGGANGTVTFDLTTLLGSPGVYSYPTVTVDAKGRITAISSNSAPAAPSASYITVSSEPGLTNERSLAAGKGIALVDNGANSTLVISSTFLGADAWIDGGSKIRTTSSVAIGGTSVFADSAGVESYFFVSGTSNLGGPTARKSIFGGDVRVSGTLTVGTGSGVTISSNDIQFGTSSIRIDRSGNDLRFFDQSNLQGWTLSQLAQSGSAASGGGGGSGDPNASYIVLNLTSSLSNERVLSGGTGITIVDNGPNSTVVISANGSVAGSTPIYSVPIVAGTVTTNTSTSGSKLSVGSMFFNPTIFNRFSGSRQYMYRAIIDTAELLVSAAVDLYDINGIVRFPPGIITGSIMSSSAQTMTQIEVDLTSQLNSVTGSGIFETRLWKTLSGSITSSVTCRNSRLDILYT